MNISFVWATMQSTYKGKSYKFEELILRNVQFFENKGLTVSLKKKTADDVVQTISNGTFKILEIRLQSHPDGSLRVSFVGSEGSPLMRDSVLPSLIGAGILVLKSQKLAEFLNKLEAEYWDMADRFIGDS